VIALLVSFLTQKKSQITTCPGVNHFTLCEKVCQWSAAGWQSSVGLFDGIGGVIISMLA
jgi:hypothetical protein